MTRALYIPLLFALHLTACNFSSVDVYEQQISKHTPQLAGYSLALEYCENDKVNTCSSHKTLEPELVINQSILVDVKSAFGDSFLCNILHVEDCESVSNQEFHVYPTLVAGKPHAKIMYSFIINGEIEKGEFPKGPVIETVKVKSVSVEDNSQLVFAKGKNTLHLTKM